MTVKIITDSTSDITDDLAQQLGITVIPLTISFGHDSYLDRVEMSTDDFYKRLSSENVFPKTTQPSPHTFADAYNKLAEETDEILVIVISGKLSGTFQSATNAKELVTNKKCRIEVIDSHQTAMGLGLLAITAAEMANEGKGLTEIAEQIEKLAPHAAPVMAFDTVKYLVKGGRVGKAQGVVGSLLSVKPILTMKDGEVSPLTRVRSIKASEDYLYKHVASHKNIKKLAVEHATTPETADELVERLSELYPKDKIYRSTVSPVLGAYMGPNVLSVTVMYA